MKSRFILAAIALSLGILSCEKNMENEPVPVEQFNAVTEGAVVLGAKIDDPYAIHNMEKAYANLKSSESVPDMEILPTHNYIRFLPKNEDELALLKSDTAVSLFDFPLHYEITGGTSYHDPDLPVDAITWQYTVLPLDYVLPNIEHEILYQVMLPEKDSNISGNNLKTTSVFNEIEKESFRITGNINRETDPDENITKGLFDRYRPSGKIQVWEDECKRFVPLRQARVQARWATHIASGYTNNNGDFAVNDVFLYAVNFAIKWERDAYDIRDGLLLQAWYNQDGKSKSWHLNIRGGKSQQYAHIHLAAFHMCYENPFGIKTPKGYPNKIKISYLHENGTYDGYYFGKELSLVGLSSIYIYGYDENGYYQKSNIVFSTTVHELGHLSHSCKSNTHIISCAKWIRESWASAVEWKYTKNYYSQFYQKTDYDYRNRQKWVSGFYTPVFIDLMDDFDQSDNGKCPYYPNDKIEPKHGYTLSYIENNILTRVVGLNSLRSTLKAYKPASSSLVTDAQIDNLLILFTPANTDKH
ncbi:MAG: hypothetical protein LBV41_08240 [Cytophagaceae bacterium]|jgi:hypothetical protein|nr:hypothetical protein [Cytophagaceae bacterium]